MHRPLATVASLAALVALAACNPDAGPGPGGTDLADRPLREGDTYVAIGDSYTAAPRTGPAVAPDGCGRTRANYPHLIAGRLGLELADSSCSGATTNHLTRPQPTLKGTHPAQLDEVDEDTDLVTFRLGANDYGLFGRVILCAKARFGSGPSPCTDIDRDAGTSSADARLADLEDNLVKALRTIRHRAPEATILVIGYPQVVPVEGTCDQLPLAPGDYAWARRVNEGLNEALEAAAAEIGVTFLDMFPASEGHDICGEEPWIAGGEPTRDDAAKWHPFPEESQAVADLVLAELE